MSDEATAVKIDAIHEMLLDMRGEFRSVRDDVKGTGPHNPGLNVRMTRLEEQQSLIRGGLLTVGGAGAFIAWAHGLWPFSLFRS